MVKIIIIAKAGVGSGVNWSSLVSAYTRLPLKSCLDRFCDPYKQPPRVPPSLCSALQIRNPEEIQGSLCRIELPCAGASQQTRAGVRLKSAARRVCGFAMTEHAPFKLSRRNRAGGGSNPRSEWSALPTQLSVVDDAPRANAGDEPRFL